jgi:hypothetical protein
MKFLIEMVCFFIVDFLQLESLFHSIEFLFIKLIFTPSSVHLFVFSVYFLISFFLRCLTANCFLLEFSNHLDFSLCSSILFVYCKFELGNVSFLS